MIPDETSTVRSVLPVKEVLGAGCLRTLLCTVSHTTPSLVATVQDEAAVRTVCRALYLLVRPNAGQGQVKLLGSSWLYLKVRHAQAVHGIITPRINTPSQNPPRKITPAQNSPSQNTPKNKTHPNTTHPSTKHTHLETNPRKKPTRQETYPRPKHTQ